MFKFARTFSKEMREEAREETEELKLGRLSKSVWIATVGVIAFMVMMSIQLIVGIGDALID